MTTDTRIDLDVVIPRMIEFNRGAAERFGGHYERFRMAIAGGAAVAGNALALVTELLVRAGDTVERALEMQRVLQTRAIESFYPA